jgi:hypothetical protein
MLRMQDSDPRRYKKNYSTAKENERDWRDFQYQCGLELRFEAIVRRDFLHHYYPVRAWDLMNELKRRYLLGSIDLPKIMKFLLHNDKFIEVEEIGQDERYWNLYLFPRTPNLIKYPHSFLSTNYYEEMRCNKK